MELNIDLISAVVFYSIIIIYLYKNREKLTVEYNILFLMKTKKLTDLMASIGTKFRDLIKVYASFGIIIGFALLVLSVYTLYENAAKMLIAPEQAAKVSIIVPGIPTSSGITLPFWFGIISIAIAAFVHEFSHGITAISENVRIKSCGIGFLLAIPLAFVEPNEDELKNVSKIARTRIAAAGPLANITLAVILALFVADIVTPYLNDKILFTGVNIITLSKDKPAYLAGIPKNTVISEVNGINVENLSSFVEELSKIKPEEKTVFTDLNGKNYEVMPGKNPSNESMAYFGFVFEQAWDFKPNYKKTWGFLAGIPIWLWKLLSWVIQVNVMLGIWNFLPIWIVDGGQFFANYMSYFVTDEKKLYRIVNFASFFVIGLLIMNLMGSYLI